MNNDRFSRNRTDRPAYANDSINDDFDLERSLGDDRDDRDDVAPQEKPQALQGKAKTRSKLP